jgi:hypothetical protein
MTQAIRDAGFTPVPEDVRLTVAGRLETPGGSTVLVLTGMTSERSIPCRAGATDLHGQAGREVVLTGRWLFEGSGALLVESVAPGPGTSGPPR